MVEYSWPRVKYKKCTKNQKINFLGESYIDPGGPGSHPGGSRTDPGAEKHPKNEFFQNFQKIVFFILSPGADFYLDPKKSEKSESTKKNPKKNRKNPMKTFV